MAAKLIEDLSYLSNVLDMDYVNRVFMVLLKSEKL